VRANQVSVEGTYTSSGGGLAVGNSWPAKPVRDRYENMHEQSAVQWYHTAKSNDDLLSYKRESDDSEGCPSTWFTWGVCALFPGV